MLCAGDTENKKQPEFYVEPTLPVENMVKGKILFIIAVTLFLVFMTQLWRFTSF